MADFADRPERVETALALAIATIERRLHRDIRRLRVELDEAEVQRLLLEGGVDAVVRRYEVLARGLAAAQQEVLLRVMRDLARELSEQLERVLDVDVSRSAVEAQLRSERERILFGLVSSQRAAAAAALGLALRRGLGIEGQARAVRDALGLTARQVAAVDRYRALLERSAAEALERELDSAELEALAEEAIEEDRPLTGSQVSRMEAAYRRTVLAGGLLALAEFEAQQATNLGSQLVMDQAAQEGVIAPDPWVQRWRTARDERVRPSHRAMEGQTRLRGQPFRSGDGNLLRYPGDPAAPLSDTRRCRCVLVLQATGVAAAAGVG